MTFRMSWRGVDCGLEHVLSTVALWSKAIPDPSAGVNMMRVSGIILQCFAEPVDVHRHVTFISQGFFAIAKLFHQLSTGDDYVWMLHKIDQKTKEAFRKFNGLPISCDGVSSQMNAQVTLSHDLFRYRLTRSSHGVLTRMLMHIGTPPEESTDARP